MREQTIQHRWQSPLCGSTFLLTWAICPVTAVAYYSVS